jgi:hypothetical protein
MLQRKIGLAVRKAQGHIVHRSMAVSIAAAFLDVSSLNLAMLQSIATFFGQNPGNQSSK